MQSLTKFIKYEFSKSSHSDFSPPLKALILEYRVVLVNALFILNKLMHSGTFEFLGLILLEKNVKGKEKMGKLRKKTLNN